MSLLNDIKSLLGPADSDVRLRHNEDLLTSLLIMAWMVEARDPYTGGHLWRVSQFSRIVATRLNLSEAEISRISVGGFLHDLGKISIPDHILGKKDKLTDQEYEVIKTHPDVGWRMLASHPLAKLAEAAVRAHHETPDGKGYPRGLPSSEIAIDAKIVGVCDAFDAMTSTRPYRRGMPIAKALSIIEDSLGRQFDAGTGQALIELGNKGHLDHIVGHSDEGIPMQECLMCGPTVVLQRGHQEGSQVFCPSCAGGYKTSRTGGNWHLISTGTTATPIDLEPVVDADVIADVVRASARSLLV